MNDFNDNITVLIIDDNSVYCTAISVAAITENIIIKIATNLEDGLGILKNDKKIEFVILDGKCFINSDQEKSGQTVSNMPIRALEKIKEINQDQNREIGYCVNTGFVDDLGESFEGVFTVFDKDEELETLFNFIKKTVSNSEKTKLRRSYKACFIPFNENFIDSKYEYLLFDVLVSIETSDYRRKNLKTIRDILEAVYLGLVNINCIPDALLNDRRKPNLEWCTRYMEGRTHNVQNGETYKLLNDVPQYIKSSFRKLKEETSQYSHVSDEEKLKLPFLSNAYTILEILEWLPSFRDTYYKEADIAI